MEWREAAMSCGSALDYFVPAVLLPGEAVPPLALAVKCISLKAACIVTHRTFGRTPLMKSCGDRLAMCKFGGRNARH